jgi:hypothetical protein
MSKAIGRLARHCGSRSPHVVVRRRTLEVVAASANMCGCANWLPRARTDARKTPRTEGW